MGRAKEEEKALGVPRGKLDRPCDSEDDEPNPSPLRCYDQLDIVSHETSLPTLVFTKVERSLNNTQNNHRRKRRRTVDIHADDADLLSSMGKGPLDKIILKYTYLYTTPLFWTHRHEKLLHVEWQPSQQASSSPPLSLQCSRHPKHRRQQRQQQLISTQGALRRLWCKDPKKPQLLSAWNNQYQPLLRLLLRPPQLRLPPPPLSFELIEAQSFIVAGSISYLEDNFCKEPFLRQQIMQFLLSGVDKSDTGNILGRISPFQNFLVLEEEDLSIYYGPQKYKFLWNVPVYRLGTKLKRNHDNKNNDIDGSYQKSTPPFWRMVHLDYTHINEALRQNKRYGSNYRKHGILKKGMTMEECTVRYDYEQGDGKWSHPHFMPGVFIAMAQRHKRNWWKGQVSGEEAIQRNRCKDQKDHKCDKKRENGTSSKEFLKKSEAASGTTDRVAPIWQALLTDGPNDRTYAHLYTTQVPPFLVDSLEKPAQCQFRVPPANTKGRRNTKNGKGNKHEDMPFAFAIRHTQIAYKPYRSFRQRLREAIVCSRDSAVTRARTRA
ncbi:hypothetical protein GQX73_g4527 [Xylaria multiplex]|uniref:Uncharacterized protein n=1 Tax=Xylaria multiplex TaxID=323545 RepID=A0A7C8ISA4_9PEZI|nr:hypothetical protein GQX73_g4527 [Xylaria multiplex]